MQKRVAALAVLAGSLALFATERRAFAQDSAGAEALFQKAHQLFEAKRYSEACPKFADSYKLDPVSGSLLALASCHEAEGKLASAWAEYVDVATRARREGKNDRADAAQQRATALEPKLAHVTVAPAPGADAVAGLVVKRDGIVVGSGTFGTALPVDKGEHTIEASAPAHVGFSRKLNVQDGASEVVSIPVLADDPNAVAPTPAPLPQQPGETPKSDKPSGFPTRTMGVVLGGAGVAAAIVGGVFGVIAIGKNSDSNTQGCDKSTNVCTGAATTTRMDAVSAGNTSTILFVVGGVLAAGGVALFIVGGPSSDSTKTSIAATPAVGVGSAGMAFTGRF